MPKDATPSEQVNIKLGTEYVNALRRHKEQNGVAIRDAVELALRAYFYRVHDFPTLEALTAVAGSLKELDVPPARVWWAAPEPLPATVAELGPKPDSERDWHGFMAYHKACKEIKERAAAVPPEATY